MIRKEEKLFEIENKIVKALGICQKITLLEIKDLKKDREISSGEDFENRKTKIFDSYKENTSSLFLALVETRMRWGGELFDDQKK